MRMSWAALALAASMAFGASAVPASAQTVDAADVVETYVEIALAGYRDTLQAAEDLKLAVETMLEQPTEENLLEAQRQWQLARIAYQQTEVFRFGNPIVDEWVDRVNAWPIDEGFIDYVDDAYLSEESDNPYYTANLIGTGEITLDGETITIDRFTPDLIRNTLDGAGGIKTNVASGFHVIEYLLWGPDTEKAEDRMGLRPVTDFVTGEDCTGGNCQRRAEYLFAAIDLLINDLEEMVSNWAVTGAARRAVTDDPEAGLSAMLQGIGSLGSGELAGNYLNGALESNNPEWEMDDFADYSHVSYLLSARGIVNLFLGEYFTLQGDLVTGPSLADLIKAEDPALDEELRLAISNTMARLRMLIRRGRDVETFDQMIGEGNDEGRDTVLAVVQALAAQTETIERVGEALGTELGSFETPLRLSADAG